MQSSINQLSTIVYLFGFPELFFANKWMNNQIKCVPHWNDSISLVSNSAWFIMGVCCEISVENRSEKFKLSFGGGEVLYAARCVGTIRRSESSLFIQDRLNLALRLINADRSVLLLPREICCRAKYTRFFFRSLSWDNLRSRSWSCKKQMHDFCCFTRKNSCFQCPFLYIRDKDFYLISSFPECIRWKKFKLEKRNRIFSWFWEIFNKPLLQGRRVGDFARGYAIRL